jgi:DNA-binding beta-propeller fold protein YncE
MRQDSVIFGEAARKGHLASATSSDWNPHACILRPATAKKDTLRRRMLVLSCALLLSLLHLPVARGQESPPDPNDGIVQVSPTPLVLDSTCVVSVLNRTTNVNDDGTWILPTVPANFGPLRARASCVRNGVTLFGQSNLFTLGSNQSVTLPDIILGSVTPIPQNIAVTTPTTNLTQAGQTTQLTAVATYSDGSSQNITAGSIGTQYQMSNPAIATVSADGLVTAVSSGTVVIQALNEGAQGILLVHVVLAGASNGGIPNSWILANFCPSFSQGVPCPQLIDPTFPSQDPDHDGLTNLQEFQNGTDPNNPDTDGDGLTDGQEVLLYHTNPLLFSTDGTGVPDGIEAATGTIGAPLSVILSKALASLTVTPSTFVLAVNSISSQSSQQLKVTGLLIDGKTTLDLTPTHKGTNYSSSDLTICNFGAPDGNIFAGNAGSCTITVSNGGFTATATGTVTGFNPASLSFVTIPGFANSVAVNGNYAYVAAGAAGLQVVNVTNRNSPAMLSSLALTGNANGIKVVGNLVFVAAGSGGLYVVDVTNPLAPALVGSISTSGVALDVSVQGNIAYVANSTNLFLVNISNPSVLQAIGTLPLSGEIRGISVDPQRGIAVVAADTAGIYVVDVSNPSNPVQLAQLATGDAHQVAIKGIYVFVADYHGLSAPYQNSLVSVDISNPGSPVIRSSITNQSLGGNLNDLTLSGDFALAADVVFVNGVPITDISDPTNLLSRAILNFPQQDDNGMGIAVDNSYVYLTTDHSAIEKFGTTGSGRLYIGQYQVLQDTKGIPPVAAISSPANGATVVQGATIQVTVNATDDIAVAGVSLLVNGQPVLTDTTVPYVFYYTIPTTVSTVTLGATAIDFGGNVGTAPNIVLNAIPDPGTTVIGRVVDGSGHPLPGFIVSAMGLSTVSANDGTFSISNVPTISVGVTGLTVAAHGVANGVVRSGLSATVPPVYGGITNVGDIVTASRPFVVVAGTNGAVSAVDTSQNPPTVIQTVGAFGAEPEGVSVTPDGSQAFVSIFGNGSPIRVFDLTKNPPAYVTDISRTGFISNTLSNTVTRDGRFVLAVWNENVVTAISTTTHSVVSSLTVPFAYNVAVTRDGTTVIATDPSHNVFRILSLSPQGTLTDTGKTIPYTFNVWAPPIAMAPNGHFALMANPEAGFVSILKIDAQHNVTLSATTIPVGSWPWGIDFTPDGAKAYVTIPGAESPVSGQPANIAMLSIDPSDNVTDTGVRISIPNGLPFAVGGLNGANSGIAIALDGKAYIANDYFNSSTQQGTITILDINTNTVIGTVALPFPSGIGVPR